MALTTSTIRKGKCHVAVFPLPFSSHPMPMLNLVLKLAAEAGEEVRFSFFNTAESNASLFRQPKYRSLPSNVKAYDVPDGVPDGHVFSGHPLEAIDLFLKTTPHCYKAATDEAVSEVGTSFTCLLTDAFLVSSGIFARDYLNGVPWIALFTPFPGILTAYLHADLIRDRCRGDNEDAPWDFIPGFRGLGARGNDLPELMTLETGSLLLQALKQMPTAVQRECAALVLKYCDALGSNGMIEDLKSKFRNVLSIGFLTPERLNDSKDEGLFSWLDEKAGRSVAYVSFGTWVQMAGSEIASLAEALEESGVAFVWSLREHLKAHLPEGFAERTRRRGRMVAWAPQIRILQHPAVGVFVTHGGSNSLYESIAGGVPIICRPFVGDQILIARMVEKVWEIGVKIDGNMFNKNEVLKSLDIVLGEKQGKAMRERVIKLKQTVLEATNPNSTAAKDFKTLVELIASTGKDYISM